MVKVDIYQGDALTGLQSLPDNSVHCCITSPPYWGLRDYGLEPQIWGGDPDCEHEWGAPLISPGIKGGTNQGVKIIPTGCTHRPVPDAKSNFCRLCGAWLGSYGSEPLHDCLGWATGAPCGQCYICHSVQIFREVRRVLRPDGTLWLNISDSYSGSGGAGGDYRYVDGGGVPVAGFG